MTCREVLDFIMDYLDGGLKEAVRAEFEVHLARCPACVAYLESYRQTVRAAKICCRPTREESAAKVPEELIQAILAARRKEKES